MRKRINGKLNYTKSINEKDNYLLKEICLDYKEKFKYKQIKSIHRYMTEVNIDYKTYTKYQNMS